MRLCTHGVMLPHATGLLLFSTIGFENVNGLAAFLELERARGSIAGMEIAAVFRDLLLTFFCMYGGIDRCVTCCIHGCMDTVGCSCADACLSADRES